MHIQKVKEKISKIPLEEMKVIKTKCRPPEKSNEILEVQIDKNKWYCERPKYFWSKLDQSFIKKSFQQEAKLLFNDQEKNVFFDERGLWWVSYELSSFYLLPYFLENPTEYIWVMSQHMMDVQRVIEILKQVHCDLNDNQKLVLNLQRLANAYFLKYHFSSSVFFVFDELIYQFRLFLLKHLDKSIVNVYLNKFLRAEITKEMLEHSHGNRLVKEADSRGVLYASGTEPVVYYRRPKYFHEYSEDMDIIEELIKKNISKTNYLKFIAFRLMVPIASQVNEEAQYVESQMLSAHTSFIMKKVAQKLKMSILDLEKLSYQQIINLLKK
jgi:hypothetical protein